MRSLLSGLAAALAGLLAMPAAAQPYAYVPNYGSNNVSVIDTATNGVVTTVTLPPGSNPYALAVNTSGTKAYISNRNSTVSVLDTSTLALSTVATGGTACFASIAVNPTGTRAYLGNECSNTLTVFDLTTSPITILTTLTGFSAAIGIAVHPSGSPVYVADYGNQRIAVVDAVSHGITSIPTPGRNPYGIVINPAGTTLYVTYPPQSIVTPVTGLPGSPVVGAPIATGSSPFAVAINASGSTVYVSNYSSGSVSAINTGTNLVTATAARSGAFGLSVNPAGNRVYVATLDTNAVSVFDAALAPITTVTTGSAAYAFGIFISQAAPAPSTADITGTITNSLGGGAMGGITIANSGAPSTSTNGSGVYSFADLASGSYTITPSVYNYTFSPTSRTVNLAGVDATGQDFVGTYNAIPDITDLRAQVVAANLTDTRVRNSLLSPLDDALVWLNGSNPNKVSYSCSNLAKFIAAVRQNISVRKLPAATGNPWIVVANDILSLSGCPTR